MKAISFAAVPLALVAANPLVAQPAATPAPPSAPKPATAAIDVPVYPYDITDRPYEVVGQVKAEVRKGTIFSKEASQAKIYNELWERARKLKADAVVNASYGDARVTLMSWGSIKATGTAIRFKPVTGDAQPAADATTAQTPAP